LVHEKCTGLPNTGEISPDWTTLAGPKTQTPLPEAIVAGALIFDGSGLMMVLLEAEGRRK